MHSGKELRCQTNNINADTTGLGKGPNTLGKAFAECGTRQRPLGKETAGKGFFAECLLLGIRQSLCRALGKEKHSANKKILEK